MKRRKLCTVLLVVGVSALYLPAANAGAGMTWKLTSSDIPSQYLPSGVSSTVSGTSNAGSGGNTDSNGNTESGTSNAGSGGNTGSGGNALTDIGGAAACISSDATVTSSCLENVKDNMIPSGTILNDGGGQWPAAGLSTSDNGQEYSGVVAVINPTTGSTAMIIAAGPMLTADFAATYPNGEQPTGNAVICRRPPAFAGGNDYSACPSGSYTNQTDCSGGFCVPDKLVIVP